MEINEETRKRLIHLIKTTQAKYSSEYWVVSMPHFVSKRFIAYCSMREDLKLCLEYIKRIKSTTDRVIKSAMTYALISLYGKCFTDASESGYPKLEPSDVFEDGTKIKESHNYLMELRHKFIAHRGRTENEISIGYMLIPKDSSSKGQVRFKQLKVSSYSEDKLKEFDDLIKYVLEKIYKKIQKNGQKANDTMIDLFTPEEISQMTINNIK